MQKRFATGQELKILGQNNREGVRQTPSHPLDRLRVELRIVQIQSVLQIQGLF